jgi:hypothetical protein
MKKMKQSGQTPDCFYLFGKEKGLSLIFKTLKEFKRI